MKHTVNRFRLIQTQVSVVWRPVLFAGALAIVGGLALASGDAASFTASAETETGNLTGNVALTSRPEAANASALVFGAAVSAPTGLQSFTGGNSIAFRWNPSKVGRLQSVTAYHIYRNGQKIGTVDPSKRSPSYPEFFRCGFVDQNIVKGQTYTYQVQAITNAGTVSGLSEQLSVNAPVNTQPVPTITVDNSLAPQHAAYMRDVVVPMLTVWYPKLADRFVFPSYPASTSLTVRLDPNQVSNFICIAYASRSLIVCNPNNFVEYDTRWDLWIHEAVHLVMGFTGNEASHTWLREGLADYAREYMAGVRPATPPAPSERNYLEGYSQASTLLRYIESKTSPMFIKSLAIELRSGVYTDDYLVRKTGKSAESHNADMRATAFVNGGAQALKFAAATDKCVGYAPVRDAYIDLVINACDGSTHQAFVPYRYPDGSIILKNSGRHAAYGEFSCVAIDFGRIDVFIGGCADPKTHWIQHTDGVLESVPHPGRCISLDSTAIQTGARLKLEPCTGTSLQRFEMIR